jgi:hypothetical protein
MRLEILERILEMHIMRLEIMFELRLRLEQS